MGQNLFTRWARSGLFLLALVSATGCKRKPAQTPTLSWSELPEPPANGPSAWRQIQSNIDEHGHLDQASALRAFALAYGPIEGAMNVPRRDRSVPLCGNPVLHELDRHHATLTESQRRTIARTLSGIARVPVAASVIEALYWDEVEHWPTWEEFTDHVERPRNHRAETDRATALVREIVPVLEQRLHRTLRSTVKVHLSYSNRSAPAAALADIVLGEGHFRPAEQQMRTSDTHICRIIVSAASLQQPVSVMRMLLAHELIHCLQFEAFQGTWEQWDSLPIWLFEGPAAYGAERLIGPTTVDGRWWNEYFLPRGDLGVRGHHEGTEFTPGETYQLFRAGYDAIGYFASLASTGADLWAPQTGRTDARILAFVDHRTSENAFHESLQWNPASVTQLTSVAARRPWGAAWDIHDVTLQPDLQNTTARAIETLPRPFDQTTVQRAVGHGGMRLLEGEVTQRPLVKFWANAAGRIRIGDHEESFSDTNYERFYCRVAPCNCPNGQPVLVPTTAVAPNAHFIVAALGVAENASFSLQAFDNSEFCPPATPPTTIDPCLVGHWRLDTAAFRRSFAAAFPGIQATGSLSSMAETVDIREDRTMVVDIPQLTSVGGSDGTRVDVTFAAHFEGLAATAGPLLLTQSTARPRVTGHMLLQVAGHAISQPLPQEVTGMLQGQATMNGRYRCSTRPPEFVYTPPQGATLRFVQ